MRRQWCVCLLLGHIGRTNGCFGNVSGRHWRKCLGHEFDVGVRNSEGGLLSAVITHGLMLSLVYGATIP